MPRPKRGDSKSELIQLALAGIDAQIQELMAKRVEIAKLAAPALAPKPARKAAVRKRAATPAKAVAPAKKKRKVSAATRKKLKEAAEKRWARAREAKGQ